ncbi:MAG: Gfo/Idh/MocA family oxidoreductase [Pseudomonadota bacterium]|nr:Gfo/Idh/MocA family oxidoreductase [Pseudomonadota bacterium]
MSGLAIAVVGAGAIGRAHAERLARPSAAARLAAIVDPAPAARDFAASLGAPWFADVAALLAAAKPDGAILATPNETHLPLALMLAPAKIPLLVEKPIAATLEDARAICAAGRKAGVPILVGHHRRHNPIIKAARAFLREGRLGRLVNVTIIADFLKPDPYFELEWRRRPGGGPILINAIHEIDLLRHLCGEIVSVQALASHAARGFEVEDTAAALMRLANGALATLTLSDATAAPWNWDLIARENPQYPRQPARANSHFLAGSEGALTLPQLEFWRYAGARGWHQPMTLEAEGYEPGDPYIAQIEHFVGVIAGREGPLVSGEDATETLRATLALHEAARSGRLVTLD